jgi:hypothetical protein
VRSWFLFLLLATPVADAHTSRALWASDPLPIGALTSDAVAFHDNLSHDDEQPAPAQNAIQALPGGPSSVSLVLAALSGLGAWRLGRSGLRATLAPLPEWYHDGGPAQIGHAHALDLTFSYDDQPVCVFEAPAAVCGPDFVRVQPVLPPLRAAGLVRAADPRGPPSPF